LKAAFAGLFFISRIPQDEAKKEFLSANSIYSRKSLGYRAPTQEMRCRIKETELTATAQASLSHTFLRSWQ